MVWDTLVQGIPTVGGISGLIALLGFVLFYSARLRKENAEARLKEKQGDTESTKPLMVIIEALQDENTRLAERMEKESEEMNRRVEKLETQVLELRKKLSGKEWLISIYEKAAKFCHTCPFIPDGEKCPTVAEYERLTK